MKLKKTISGVLAVTTLLLGSLSTLGNASAYSVETKDIPATSGAATSQTSGDNEDALITQEYDYGLNDTIEGGAILHAWEWSFETIKNNMPLIAQSGYTAVQTSPVSQCYLYNNNPSMTLMGDVLNNGVADYDGKQGAWWWTYQPTSLTVGNYQLGNATQYKEMCQEAKKYGVKIITDIVANHTTSHNMKDASGNEIANTDLDAADYFAAISPSNHNALYHSKGLADNTVSSSSGARYQIINWKRGGLPDINTENPAYQKYLLDYLNELIRLGCDGFRFDTARNIGVSSLDGTYSDPTTDVGSYTDYNFWKVVTGKDGVTLNNQTYHLSPVPSDFFIYGEILGNDIGNGQDNQSLFNAYADYISVTDSAYGDTLRSCICSGSFSSSSLSGWGGHPLTSDKLVTWAESHDSYCNKHDSGNINHWQIRACWAVVAARSGGTPLFFSRPDGSSASDSKYSRDSSNNKIYSEAYFWGKNVIGERGNDEFFHPDVVAANKFRNAMSKKEATQEYLRNVNSNTSVLQIDRFPSSGKTPSNCGTCIINISNSEVSVAGQATSIANGTYYDTITGQKFVVENGAFTSESGKIGGRSIATIYNAANIIATPGSKSFTSDSIDITATISGSTVSTGTYTVKCEGQQDTTGTFTSGTPFSIGSNVDVTGTSKDITLILEANVDDTTITKQYVYTKRDSNDVTYAYFDKSRGFGDTVYAYIHKTVTDPDNSKSICIYKNAEWPGVQMTEDPISGYLRIEIPPELKDANIIFNNGSSTQYPVNNSGTVLNLDNKSMLLTASATSLTEYETVVISDDNIFPEEDTDLSTYRYTYFFNSFAWSGSPSAVMSNGSRSDELMLQYSDDLHCYYCKYPVNRSYTSIQFKFGSNSITSSEIKPGMVFVPTAVSTGTWILPSSIAERTIYFSSTNTGWTTGININLKNGSRKNSGSMTKTLHSYTENGTKKYGADIYDYCYTYYYPMTNANDKDYATVQFVKDTSYSTGDITIPADKDKIYVYSRGTGSGTTYSGASTELDTKSVSVNITYTGNEVANSKGSATYSLDTQQTINTSVDITNGNIPKALSDASTALSMTSVFDDFTFYGSQFQYVSKIASLTDDRIGDGTLPYCAYVNPETLSKQSDAFSGVFGNSDNYISTLNSAQNNWVKYIDTQGDEISLDQIHSDFANLARIEVYAFSKPKTYTVKFHYPTAANSSTVAFKNDTLFANTSNTELYHCRYNELLEDATTDIQNNMIIPTGKTFDGWYMLTTEEVKNNGTTTTVVTSYLKVSSEQNFKYRITDQNIDLYAVYRTSSTPPDATATALASSVDKFQVDVPKESQSTDSGVRYRYNTILNINDYKTTDGTVSDVAVVYVYGGSVFASSAKEQITNSIINSKETGTTTAISGTNYKLYKYTTGSSGTVELTNKNRLQFVLTLKDTQVENSGTYSNVLAFVAYKCYNGTWTVSDNCVQYVNGEAAPTMFTNN